MENGKWRIRNEKWVPIKPIVTNLKVADKRIVTNIRNSVRYG